MFAVPKATPAPMRAAPPAVRKKDSAPAPMKMGMKMSAGMRVRALRQKPFPSK